MKNILFLALSLLAVLAFSACSDSSSSSSASDDPATDLSSSSASDDSVSDAKKATCAITQNEENAFEMIMDKPDSGTVTISMTYENGLFTNSSVTVFDESVSQSELDVACAETKSDANGDKAEGFTSTVTCEGNTIRTESTMQVMMNPMTIGGLTSSFVEMCEQVQKTGIIPDDDSEE